MANFKGGFAFNNEAAKVEVEQAPDGTLVSCVNPVTGESLGGADNYSQVIEGTLAAPFGNYQPVSIGRAIYNGGVSGLIAVDASSLGITAPIIIPLWIGASDPSDIEGSINGVTASSVSMQYSGDTPVGTVSSAQLIWRTAVDYILAAYMGGQYVNLPDTLPTTVTLYWHPMPE